MANQISLLQQFISISLIRATLNMRKAFSRLKNAIQLMTKNNSFESMRIFWKSHVIFTFTH